MYSKKLIEQNKSAKTEARDGFRLDEAKSIKGESPFRVIKFKGNKKPYYLSNDKYGPMLDDALDNGKPMSFNVGGDNNDVLFPKNYKLSSSSPLDKGSKKDKKKKKDKESDD